MKRQDYAATIIQTLVRVTSVAELKAEAKQKELAKLSFQIADQMVVAEKGEEGDEEEDE